MSEKTSMEQVEEIAQQVARAQERVWWAWPLAMVVISALSVGLAILVSPGPDEWSYIFGRQLGGPCGFEVMTDLACPSCGMTRSWTYLVRGEVWQAVKYNPAGATLLMALMAMGVIGLVRLVTRDPRKLRIPVHVLSTVMLVWLIGPYTLHWVARLFGFNPLP